MVPAPFVENTILFWLNHLTFFGLIEARKAEGLIYHWAGELVEGGKRETEG